MSAPAPDQLGNLLRDFYAAFGTPNEGPPSEFNVTAAMGTLALPQSEEAVLRDALRDTALLRDFRDCREILDDLATRLTSNELLRELSTVQPPSEAFEGLSSGVLWFALAASLDRRQDGLPLSAFDGIDLPLPVRVQLTVQGSLVLRLYVSLVYMREGPLNEMVSGGARLGKPCCGRVKALLNSEYVRRIRNALSHGSFSPCAAGIVFRDERRAIVATPGFLDWLATWLMLIQLQATAAVGGRRIGVPRCRVGSPGGNCDLTPAGRFCCRT